MTTGRLPSTIAAPVEHTLEIKRSVFLTHLAPVASVEEADAVIAAVRKLRWDARHHCTALVVGTRADRQRSNDDGEPAGTAGVPMLEVLRRREVTDVVAVVSRWFGGVLLGAGGLVRAYGNAVASALDDADVVGRALRTQVSMEVPHADAGRVLAFLHQWVGGHDAVLDPPTYGQAAVLSLWVPADQVPTLDADLAALTGGAVATHAGEIRVVDLPAR
ncbi:YigZ family protein [Demequina sp. SYSU T00192]|uniref:YigZ family protein n=1 Tax=Demequina litoralis TaxID=3051660 RepID=A0ABT8G5M5_9MICO|nr:YigZ family protein [Demequina sp. SYSU T00192]MDN4474435.1 YigZ family protein [Demequina sp. SYSU T00192]